MKRNAERYKLCSQCVIENKFLHDTDSAFQRSILREIQKGIDLGFEWRNLCSSFDDQNFWSKLVCYECSYILEHTVLSNGRLVVFDRDHVEKEYYEKRLKELKL